MTGKNYYRLSNDILLLLGEKVTEEISVITNNEINKLSIHETPHTRLQYIDPILDNVLQVDNRGNDGMLFVNNVDQTKEIVNCYRVKLMVRQGYNLTQASLGFLLTLMNQTTNTDGTAGRRAYSIIASLTSIKPIQPLIIDGSTFYSGVELIIPELFFNGTNTLYTVDNEFKLVKVQDNWCVQNNQSVLNVFLQELQNYNFLSTNDLSIGNIENVINLNDDGFVEISIKNTDEFITIEGSIYAQLGLEASKPKIEVFHNIIYGFTNDIEQSINDIVIFRDVVLSNNSNGVVPVEYKPIIPKNYKPDTVGSVIIFAVESRIVVGDTQFTRYNETKFDYVDFFPKTAEITINPVNVVNNYTQTQNVIEEKETIKPVIIQQPVGFNIANQNNVITYTKDSLIAFKGLYDIQNTSGRYQLLLKLSKTDNQLDSYLMPEFVDPNDMLMFKIPASLDFETKLKEGFVCNYQLKRDNLIHSVGTIIL